MLIDEVEFKELDHSSVGALVADLNRHRDRVFCFISDQSYSRQWKLVKAIQVGELVKLVWDDADPECTYSLNDGWLLGAAVGDSTDDGYYHLLLKVMIQSDSFVDASLRRRLNGNLRGVFS